MQAARRSVMSSGVLAVLVLSLGRPVGLLTLSTLLLAAARLLLFLLLALPQSLGLVIGSLADEMHEAVDEALLELLNVVLETGDEVVDLFLDVIPRAREWVRLLVLVLGESVPDDLDVDLWVRKGRACLSVKIPPLSKDEERGAYISVLFLPSLNDEMVSLSELPDGRRSSAVALELTLLHALVILLFLPLHLFPGLLVRVLGADAIVLGSDVLHFALDSLVMVLRVGGTVAPGRGFDGGRAARRRRALSALEHVSLSILHLGLLLRRQLVVFAVYGSLLEVAVVVPVDPDDLTGNDAVDAREPGRFRSPSVARETGHAGFGSSEHDGVRSTDRVDSSTEREEGDGETVDENGAEDEEVDDGLDAG